MRQKYNIKKLNLLLMILLTIFSSCVFFTYPQKAYASQNIPEGFEKVSKTQNLALYCNPKTCAIAVKDLRNGYVWKSVVDKELYDVDSANDKWKSYMTSLLKINYVAKNNMNIIEAGSAAQVKDVKISYKDSGIVGVFDFKDASISVTLEIILEEDSLVVRVPADKILESGEYFLVSIELMPFFGAADRTEDGYLLYPDGSGGITNYSSFDLRPGEVKEFTWNIYGSEQVNLRDYTLIKRDQKYQAMLPVYGIKNGSNAILAAAINGEEDTDIKLYPEGYVVNLNRMFFSFNYRYFYNMNLSNITVNGVSVAKNPVVKKIDKSMIMKDHEVKIFFLGGKDANYSGMANVYRDYLIKNNLLKKAVKDNDNIPMGIDFFMGIKEERLIFDKFIPMTTFKNAVTISEELKKAGLKDMQVMLKGWTKGGYGAYPINWPPDKKLGGADGLKAYSEYALANSIKLYLQNNFTQANIKNGGFSSRKDIVMQGSNLPVTDPGKKEFLLNPVKALERLANFFKEFKGNNNDGVAFESIGKIIYHDYNKSNPSGRVETAQRWEEMIGSAAKKQSPVAVEGGNQYVLKYADRLSDIPVKSSEYHITDESVPFYQMVVHGMIPYTSEPANLAYDIVSHKLKWVEYGCMPSFELTYQKSINLKDTSYNRLFTSYYGDWCEQAAEIYREFNARLKKIWSEKITGHEKIAKDLYRVSYGNGTIVYINYNDKDIKYEGYLIKAQDYLVVEKGGK